MREPKKFGRRKRHSVEELENVAKKVVTENKSNPYDPIFGLKRNDKVFAEETSCTTEKIEEESNYVVGKH